MIETRSKETQINENWALTVFKWLLGTGCCNRKDGKEEGQSFSHQDNVLISAGILAMILLIPECYKFNLEKLFAPTVFKTVLPKRIIIIYILLIQLGKLLWTGSHKVLGAELQNL